MSISSHHLPQAQTIDSAMADKTTALAKATKELEDLYLGVPDESVDLSFKDLTNVQQNDVAERKSTAGGMAPIDEEPPTGMNKSPSLDFAKGLRAGAATTNYGGDNKEYELELYRERLARNSCRRSSKTFAVTANTDSRSACEDALSAMSVAASALGEVGRRKRPGIPHSNICALCNAYIYFFRHRCLVCGRVYCRNCVGMGMGEMSEGRKCVECLGRRYSQRYIKRVGQACFWRYPSRVKVQELMWAEKGPRRSNERRYRSGASSAAMLSPVISMPGSPRVLRPATRLGSPMPGSPVASHHLNIGHDNSFVMSSMHSPNPHGFPL